MKYQVNKTTSNNFINLKIKTFSANYFKALRFNKIIHKKPSLSLILLLTFNIMPFEKKVI